MIKKTKQAEPVLVPLVDAETKRTITEDNKKAKRPNLAPLPAIGTRAKRTRTITENDIVRFADVSGDHNPLHLDAAYAAQTFFASATRSPCSRLQCSPHYWGMICPVQGRSIWGRH